MDCQPLFGRSSSSGHAPRGSSSLTQAPSFAVRLAAKILIRRYSGFLGHEQASRIDNLMYQHDEQQRLPARTKDCSSSRHTQDEEDCAQARDRSTGDQTNTEAGLVPLLTMNRLKYYMDGSSLFVWQLLTGCRETKIRECAYILSFYRVVLKSPNGPAQNKKIK